MTDTALIGAPMSDPLAVVVARMEGKLDAALARMDSQAGDISAVAAAVQAHAEKIAVLESASLPARLTSLERKIWMAAGAAAAAGGGVGAVVVRVLGA